MFKGIENSFLITINESIKNMTERRLECLPTNAINTPKIFRKSCECTRVTTRHFVISRNEYLIVWRALMTRAKISKFTWLELLHKMYVHTVLRSALLSILPLSWNWHQHLVWEEPLSMLNVHIPLRDEGGLEVSKSRQ